jgi:hypothetical protein
LAGGQEATVESIGSDVKSGRPLATSGLDRYPKAMGEHTDHRITGRPRIARKRPGEQTAEAIGRRLLRIVVYDKRCRIGATLTLCDLAETSEVGDWKMPDFKTACSYAVSQGWLIVIDDVLTLMTAGLAAG